MPRKYRHILSYGPTHISILIDVARVVKVLLQIFRWFCSQNWRQTAKDSKDFQPRFHQSIWGGFINRGTPKPSISRWLISWSTIGVPPLLETNQYQSTSHAPGRPLSLLKTISVTVRSSPTSCDRGARVKNGNWTLLTIGLCVYTLLNAIDNWKKMQLASVFQRAFTLR